MLRKISARKLRECSSSPPSLSVARASVVHPFTLSGAGGSSLVVKKRRDLRFNMVVRTMDYFRQFVVTVSETARGFAATARADPPYTFGGFNHFPAFPGTCTVANGSSSSSSTTSYAVGGTSPDGKSNHLFSLHSADLLSPPPPTGCGPLGTAAGFTCDSIIPPPWRIHASMKMDRENPAVVPHDGKLFIFGGCEGTQSWLEIFDTSTGTIESRDLPDHLREDTEHPIACFLWDSERLFMLHCDYPTPRLYAYSLQHDTWELLDNNFPPLMSIYTGGPYFGRRNLVPVGRDTVFIIDKSDLWLVYDLSSRRTVGEVRLDGVPKDRDALQAFISSASGDESWIIRMFIAGEDAYEMGAYPFDLNYLANMSYAKVRVRSQGDKFVADVESLTEVAVDPYIEGTKIFPLQNLEVEEEEEEQGVPCGGK